MWRRSFFNCPSENNEIAFRHSQFVAGATESCTNGAIIGQSLSSDNGQFISQLSIMVSPDIIGQTLTCEHDDGSRILLIGSVKMTAGRYHTKFGTHKNGEHLGHQGFVYSRGGHRFEGSSPNLICSQTPLGIEQELNF